MRRYETIFILDPDLEEEQTLSVTEKVKGIITQANGEILKVEDWRKTENSPTKSKKKQKVITF